MRLSRKEFFGVRARGAAGSIAASAAGAETGVIAREAGVDAKPKKLEGAAIKGATDGRATRNDSF